MFSACNVLEGGNDTIQDTLIKQILIRGPHAPSETVDPRSVCNYIYPTHKQVIKGEAIGELPIPTKENNGFGGWYGDLLDPMTKITKETIPAADIIVLADWKENINITYDSTSGKFDNNETTYTIPYEYEEVSSTRYSHTPNIGDDGEANYYI